MDSILLSSSIHGGFLLPPKPFLPPRSSLRLPLLTFSASPRCSILKASSCASNASPASPVPAHGHLSRALRSASSGLVLLAALLSAGLRAPPALADPSAVAATEERIDPRGADAAEVAEPLAQLLDSNSEAVAALRTLLYQKLEEGEDAEALVLLNRLMAAQPDAAEWKLLAARLNAEIGEAAESRRLFEEVLAADPLSFEALFENAVLMDRCGEGAAVIERLERALEVARAEQDKAAAREVLLIVAQMRFLQKDVDGALSTYEDLAREDPKDYRPFFCQGVIYSLLDRNEEAKDKFSKYHQLSPRKFDVDAYLQTPLSRMKLFSAAAEDS